jgi:ABC-2 type transport system permease protein
MAFGLRWSGTVAFLLTEVRLQVHDLLALSTATLVQAVLVVFVAVLAPDLLAFALVGAMVYSAFLIGQRLLNEAAYLRIDQRVNELYHASPMSPEAYFVGMATGMLVAYAPTILVFVPLVQLVHPLGPLEWAAVTGAVLGTWVVSSSLGYVISTLFKDMKTIWPYSSLLTNLLGIVPPVFYPIGLLPPEVHPIALVVPTSAATSLAAHAAGLEPLAPGAVALAGIALAVQAVVLLLVGIAWARRTAREA